MADKIPLCPAIVSGFKYRLLGQWSSLPVVCCKKTGRRRPLQGAVFLCRIVGRAPQAACSNPGI